MKTAILRVFSCIRTTQVSAYLINVDVDVDIAKFMFLNYLKYLSDHRPSQKLSLGSLKIV